MLLSGSFAAWLGGGKGQAEKEFESLIWGRHAVWVDTSGSIHEPLIYGGIPIALRIRIGLLSTLAAS